MNGWTEFIELKRDQLDDAMIEVGFEPTRHLEYEDSVGCTVKLNPQFELAGTGGVWCLAIEVTDVSSAFAFVVAASRQLTREQAADLANCGREHHTYRRAGDTAAIYYFRHFVLEED